MGMFDNVIVDVNILPDLTEDEKLLLEQEKGWQTKDFENKLTNIYIVKNSESGFRHRFVGNKFPYKIQIKKSEWEVVPFNERPYPNAEPDSWQGLCGSLRETNVKIVDLTYTGKFTFYTTVEKILSNAVKEIVFYDFVAEVEEGQIISIERLID